MPLFHRGAAGAPSSSSSFAASPLSPGVPLDGTDTVPGLRQLARAAELDRASRLLDTAGRNGFAPGRRYARYKGPYLESLRTGDLRRPPRSWAEFCGRPEAGGAAAAASSGPPKAPPAPSAAPTPWSYPESMDALRERGEENIVYFLPNYLRLAAAVVILLALLTRPLALVGLAGMAGTYAAAAAGLLGPASAPARPAPSGAAAAGPAPPPPPLPLKSVVQLAAYILAAYTRAPALAFRGGALAAAVVTLHACLLAAPSERAAARRTGRPPGVRLSSVLTGRPGPLDPTPDPRRAVRELGAGVAALARAAAAGGRVAVGEAADRAARWGRGVLGLGGAATAPVTGRAGALRAALRPVR